MDKDIEEKLCRFMCEFDGVNPDTTFYPVRQSTMDKLGDKYPAWKWRTLYMEDLINYYEELKAKK